MNIYVDSMSWILQICAAMNIGAHVSFWIVIFSGYIPPGGKNGNLLQYSFQNNPMDREAWWTTVFGVTKSWKQLSTHAEYVLSSRTAES